MYNRHNTIKEFINKLNFLINVCEYTDRYFHTSLFKPYPSLKTTKLETFAFQTSNKTFFNDQS